MADGRRPPSALHPALAPSAAPRRRCRRRLRGQVRACAQTVRGLGEALRMHTHTHTHRSRAIRRAAAPSRAGASVPRRSKEKQRAGWGRARWRARDLRLIFCSLQEQGRLARARAYRPLPMRACKLLLIHALASAVEPLFGVVSQRRQRCEKRELCSLFFKRAKPAVQSAEIRWSGFSPLFTIFRYRRVSAAQQRPLRARPAKAEDAASSLIAHSSLGRLMKIAHAGMCCRPCPSTLVGPRA